MTLSNHQSLTIHTDGGSRGNPGPAATGIVIYDSNHQQIHSFGTFIGVATNNVAEYTAVIHALEWLIAHPSVLSPSPNLLFKLDSKLVVEQISRRWKIKEPRLFELASSIWSLIQAHHLQASFIYIPRFQNAVADKQANIALDNQ